MSSSLGTTRTLEDGGGERDRVEERVDEHPRHDAVRPVAQPGESDAERHEDEQRLYWVDIPAGREDEIARKVLIKHLQSGNSYGIQLKEQHCKFPQVELGPWVEGSRTVGTDWKPAVLEGWEPPLH